MLPDDFQSEICSREDRDLEGIGDKFRYQEESQIFKKSFFCVWI